MRAQGGVVGLDHGGGDLGSWVDAELQLRLLPESTERRSIRREVKPEPVPPPKEWKMRKP